MAGGVVYCEPVTWVCPFRPDMPAGGGSGTVAAGWPPAVAAAHSAAAADADLPRKALLTVDEVIRLLRYEHKPPRLARAAVWRIVRSGRLVKRQVGRSGLITRASVEAFLSGGGVRRRVKR